MKIILGALAYIAVTFAVQAASHFGINTEHYAAIPHLRPEPIFALGIVSMVIQGTVLAWLYPHYYRRGRPVVEGCKFGIMTGSILVSYIALAEPAKYVVPSVPSWMAVEAVAGLVQFTLAGIAIGLIYGARSRA
ncbi:hypothetical protein [Methylocaldum sp. GT1TLB]|jgi:hypothetical protein|uniref:hypothetical protein n=1 Tax=Methylocaldum sp. GT1TLB TaxID=3438965 RepID=UPI003DA1C5A6